MSDYNVGVEVDVDYGELDALESRINKLKSKTLNINVNTNDAERKIANLMNGKTAGAKRLNVIADTSGARKEIVSLNGAIGRGMKPFKLNVDISEVEKQLNRIENRAKTISLRSPGKSSQRYSYSELYSDLEKIAKLSNVESKLDISKNAREVDVVANRIEKLLKSYDNVLDVVGNELKPGQLNALNNLIDETNFNLDRIKAKMQDSFDASQAKAQIKETSDSLKELLRIQKQIGDTRINLINAGSDADVEKYTRRLKELEAQAKLTEASLGELDEKQIKKYFDNLDAQERRVQDAADKKWQNAEVDYQKRIVAEAKAERALGDKKSSFTDKIDKWLHNNTAALDDFGDRIYHIRDGIAAADAMQLNNLKTQFNEVTTQAEIANKTGLNFRDSLGQKIREYSSYFATSSLMFGGVAAIQSMVTSVMEVDKAMTELKRVTDLSDAGYDNLYSELTVSANEYGVALNDIISATADWTRSGFEAYEAKGLAEVTTMYQHIADLDYKTAFENLQTAYKGFEGELTSMFGGDAVAAVGYIGDILNELDNNYAVTAAGVGEALKRSASALDVAGNSIQETAGMVTGITEVTQDPEKAGNALKVVSMRLRGMKGGLEELGEEVDSNVTNLSKMQGQVLNLTHGKVNIFDDMGEFKSTYDIMQGIANVWDELNSVEQADLLETIAGKKYAYQYAQKCA